jgi:hypothetical protein
VASATLPCGPEERPMFLANLFYIFSSQLISFLFSLLNSGLGLP